MSARRPRILFLHRNSVGQFEFFGSWLASNGWDVTFAMGGDGPDQDDGRFAMRFFRLRKPECDPGDFRYALEFASQNAVAAADWMVMMRDVHGYVPDIVIAHVGWGVGLCTKQVWHTCRYVAYHEWYYADRDWSKGGAIERPVNTATLVSNRLRTLPITAEFDSADAHWCPTSFQANRFPPVLRDMLTVVPDGVDCEMFAPDPRAKSDFESIGIPKDAPLLTYATRGMEPVRGFPQFMRALSLVQARRPDVHALIVANERVAYGPQLPKGQSWRNRMLESYDFDETRMHIRPVMPRRDYLRVLQASTAHIYFSEPFVTSWSLIEALATGCLVIGSLTGPVEEFVEDMVSGILVDMDDAEETADMFEWVLDNPQDAAALRAEARRRMQTRYASRTVFPEKERRLSALLCSKAAAGLALG